MNGFGAGVRTGDGRFGREVEAGRVRVNNCLACPAHAVFGGYRQSGIGRETHRMMLDHYSRPGACRSPTTRTSPASSEAASRLPPGAAHHHPPAFPSANIPARRARPSDFASFTQNRETKAPRRMPLDSLTAPTRMTQRPPVAPPDPG